MAQYVRRGTFAACFDFGAMMQFSRDNLNAYLTVWAVSLGVGVIVSSIAGSVRAVLILIPCFGQAAYFLLFGSLLFMSLLINGHLAGQLIRADDARLTGGVGMTGR